MTPEPYNFKRPTRLSPEVQHRAELWLRAACAVAANRTAGQFPEPLAVSLGGLDTVVCQDAQAALPDTAVGYPLRGPQPDWAGLLTWPRPLLLALAQGLTGELPAEPPQDRELTAVEASLADYAVREFLVGPLRDTWPSPEPLTLEAGPCDPGVKWARPFPPDRVLAEAALLLRGPFGEHACRLLLPATALPGAAAPAARPQPPGGEEVRERLKGLVQEAPVEVTVSLGQAEVPLLLLGKLKPGDVLVLSQRVREPLPVAVAGRTKFLAWPGRVEARQACQISSVEEK
jgi:flagellar motor switch protein FliM